MQRLSRLREGALYASNTTHVDDGNECNVWVDLSHRASWQRSKNLTSRGKANELTAKQLRCECLSVLAKRSIAFCSHFQRTVHIMRG